MASNTIIRKVILLTPNLLYSLIDAIVIMLGYLTGPYLEYPESPKSLETQLQNYKTLDFYEVCRMPNELWAKITNVVILIVVRRHRGKPDGTSWTKSITSGLLWPQIEKSRSHGENLCPAVGSCRLAVTVDRTVLNCIPTSLSRYISILQHNCYL